MRILFVATKSPWPPVDGGRVVMHVTLRALRDAGHEVTLSAPWSPADGAIGCVRDELSSVCRPELVAARPSAWAVAWLRALVTGQSASLVRHALPPVRTRIESLLSSSRFDVVHAEQLQAVAQCAPATARGLPLVLRAQNVESDLWAALAGTGGPRSWLAGVEARRVARAETAFVRSAAATVALTAEDAARLRRLAGEGAVVCHVAAPFESELPAAGTPLPGAPPLVMLGSGGWLPNRLAADWLIDEVWPVVAAQVPEAVLHVFGAVAGFRPSTRSDRLVRHAPPVESREAFGSNAILIVPVRIASGVRVKILEAWARGVPVIATPEAAAGLGVAEGEGLLLASTAPDFARAVVLLARDPALRTRLIAQARAHLRRHHDPALVGAQLTRVYEAAAARGAQGSRLKAP